MDNLMLWGILILGGLMIVTIVGNISLWFYKQAAKDIKKMLGKTTKEPKSK